MRRVYDCYRLTGCLDPDFLKLLATGQAKYHTCYKAITRPKSHFVTGPLTNFKIFRANQITEVPMGDVWCR